ncbi:MAG TPA: C-GCAxxG-C-C family protein [Victivallales bacterium]|nr:C-GCAxxG-C-C family protein [Victivallales bacterium]
MNDKTTNAENLFKSGYSCSQAVLAPFAEEFSLDIKHALKISGSFGGGIGGMGLTCGAITGAIMVLGLKYGSTDAEDIEAKKNAKEKGREFIEKFKSQFSYTTCSEILDIDISVPENLEKAKNSNAFDKCPDLVKGAVEILEEILKEK